MANLWKADFKLGCSPPAADHKQVFQIESNPSSKKEICVKAIWFLTLLTMNVVANARANPVGCYSVLVEEIAPPSVEPMKIRRLVRSKDIRLTSEPATAPWTNSQFFKVLPLAPRNAFNYAASYWELKTERLFITWSNNGLSGVEMDLTPSENGFEGIVQSFWDFQPATSDRRRAVLTRMAC